MKIIICVSLLIDFAIAYEASKRLVRSTYVAFCPEIEDFKNILSKKSTILASTTSYHIDAILNRCIEGRLCRY